MNLFVVEPALPSEAEHIVRVRNDAIRTSARPYYSDEMLEEWANPDSDSLRTRFLEAIQHEMKIVITLKTGNRIIGFGIVDTTRSYLGAVYVDPAWGRKGVGGKILEELESSAVDKGLDHLVLNASLNSHIFYEKNGYETIEKGFHVLQSGRKMECIKMKKCLKG